MESEGLLLNRKRPNNTVHYYIAAIQFQRHDYNQAWKHLLSSEKIVFAKDHKPKALLELRQALERVCPEP